MREHKGPTEIVDGEKLYSGRWMAKTDRKGKLPCLIVPSIRTKFGRAFLSRECHWQRNSLRETFEIFHANV